MAKKRFNARFSKETYNKIKPLILSYLKENPDWKFWTSRKIATELKSMHPEDFPGMCSTESIVSMVRRDSEDVEANEKSIDVSPSQMRKDWKEGENNASLEFTVPEHVETLEEALFHANVDLDIWAVDKFETSHWTTPVKKKSRDKDGNEIVELEKVQNSRVKVTFKSKAGKFDPVKFREELMADLKGLGPKVPKIKYSKNSSDKNLLNVNIFDLHFDKVSWTELTGEHYDTEEAAKRFLDGLNGLVNRAQGYEIDRILFPIGNDFFNSDKSNPFPSTTKGTYQDSDLPGELAFREGRKLLIKGVEFLKQVAPVDVVIIPGNHDAERAFYVGDVLDVRYENDKNVNIDNRPIMRKYYEYGNNLIGLTHGDKEKIPNLAQTMAQEEAQAWARTFYRYWKLGHLHHEKSFRHLSTQDYMGVIIDFLPSLSATDPWHHRMGYIGSIKGCKADIHNSEEGLINKFSYNLKK